jgi:hypothetical protein
MAATQHAGGSTRAPLRALVERHRDDIKLAVARHRGKRVRLFGSVARGEEREYGAAAQPWPCWGGWWSSGLVRRRNR